MPDFRWLHLSDFHTGKDNYGQVKLFRYIVDYLDQNRKNGIIPDAVFITGDIASQGGQEQYRLFFEEFMVPLTDVYDGMPKIYMVPGNHDLDRKKCRVAAKSLYQISEDTKTEFFDVSEEGFLFRSEIFSRFLNFEKCSKEYGSDICFPVHEIFGKKGCFTDIISMNHKNIGIIGTNTAWLSNSDADYGKLALGKYILEEALAELKSCEYKIVLGHHPLDWMQWEHRKQIKTLLAKNHAVYLHGHLHKNSGELMLSYDKGFLALQSGAAFQAREDEVYYNSLQWGELDYQNETVRIRPEKWSANRQEFITDDSENLSDGCYQDNDGKSWLFPNVISFLDKHERRDKKQIKVPPGWCLIDKAFIEKRSNPSSNDILKYFDGKEPSYDDIFSSFLPVRDIVMKIRDEFLQSNRDGKTKCVLITGAGGEGKTTVLLQAVRELTQRHGWQALVLRQAERDMDFPENRILNLAKEGNWIICADNCFTISNKLFGLLKKLAKKREKHVHLLMCARDIDWHNSDSGKMPWRNYASYRVFRMRGITENDAEKIVRSWGNLGEEGLGRLNNLSLEDAKKELCESATNEISKNEPEEGALLGAMLTVRHGEELQEHIYNMLLRLQEIPLGSSHNLLDAFACIVAMHSEKLYYLSKIVMAQRFNVELKNVKKNILTPLGDEAASAVSGDLIYTRHILIAKAARKLLDKEFGYEMDEIFVELAVAAAQAKEKGEFVESYARWAYLSDYFINKNQSLAIRLDQNILNVNPYDPFIIVHLSRLYRDVKDYDMALKLFREVDYIEEDRPFFCEWALVEANADNKAASVCLSAIALSDHITKKIIDVKNAYINLFSIANTFYELYKQYKNNDYLCASLAAVRIGERIDKDNDMFNKYIKNPIPQFEKKILDEDIRFDKCLQKGIITAAEYREVDFKPWVPDICSLEFKRLFSMADICS